MWRRRALSVAPGPVHTDVKVIVGQTKGVRQQRANGDDTQRKRAHNEKADLSAGCSRVRRRQRLLGQKCSAKGCTRCKTR